MKTHPRAFTLVELLVVIGIIALLVSILLPVLNKARVAATRATCSSQLRQLMLGMTMYAQNNKGDVPRGTIYNDAPPAGRDSTKPPYMVYRADFYLLSRQIAGTARGDYRMFYCPDIRANDAAFDGHWNEPNYVDIPYLQIGYFYVLNQMGCYEEDSSYLKQKLSVNKWYPKATLWMSMTDLGTATTSHVTNATKIPVFTDIVNLPRPFPVADPVMQRKDALRYLVGQHTYNKKPAPGANTAFMDGHVSWISPDKLAPMGQAFPRHYDTWWIGFPE